MIWLFFSAVSWIRTKAVYKDGARLMARILIIDDDEIFSELLCDIVEDLGHHASRVFTGEEGKREAASRSYDIVFLDIKLPDGNGLDIIPDIRESPSSPEVIIITGYGDANGAELAIRNGVWDYIEKPSSVKEIALPLSRALDYRMEKAARQSRISMNLEGIVGNSPAMRICEDLVARAATNDANVLITGETGTGKELFAWAIHRHSSRSKGNFVVVDCASLPETLVESTLFGHEKGAFTGADKARDGLVRQAHGGTLFLDEIGDLPLTLQKNFLRVLQEHRFRPVGGEREMESDFRMIAATNKDLAKMSDDGEFREDLLFRIRSLVLELPPLRNRKQDIKDLLSYYLGRLCEKHNTGIKGYATDFLDMLLSYDWPGNVREFISALERALVTAYYEPTLFPAHLPLEIRIEVKKAQLHRMSPSPLGTATEVIPTLQEVREKTVAGAEKRYLEELLMVTKGNMADACRISGLSRPRLYAVLKKFSLTGRRQP